MYGLPLCLIIIYKIKNELKLKPKMITEKEVSDILGEELFEINYELEKIPNSNNIYNIMQCFADFTKKLIKKGDLNEVKHCFKLADKMMKNGNNTVKNAVENCYVFSISTVIDIASPINERVKQLLRHSLRKEYNRQVLSSGI